MHDKLVTQFAGESAPDVIHDEAADIAGFGRQGYLADLTDLLETTAANFGGEGAQFHQTIQDFSRLSETLDDNKEELFGSLRQVGRFVHALAENDSAVRRFNASLAGVSTVLEGERDDLALADVQADLLERADPAVGHRQPGDVQQSRRLRGRAAHSSPR